MSAVTRAQRRPLDRGALRPKLLRYAAGSGVATACSEAVFLLVYGPLHGSSTLASVLGWLAGAIPNFWLNRTWTWGRRGRPGLLGEVVPYAAIILVTLGLAITATGAADHVLRGTGVSAEARTLAVGATFLLVYAVVFVARFLLLERLFGSAHQGTAGSEEDA